jgi:hypothetical protein
MYLHGILHRIEGDYDNARAWYSDVKESDIYAKIWGKEGHTWKSWKELASDDRQLLDEGQKFLDAVQRFKETKGKEGDKAALEEKSRKELDEITRWCEERFGIHKMEDASSAWVKASDEIRKMGEDQVNGDNGRRNF